MCGRSAAGLIASGVEPGDRVALFSRTRYEWTVIDYAIWTAGGVTVPIYETSSEEQVAWNTGDSGAVAIFVETRGTQGQARCGSRPASRRQERLPDRRRRPGQARGGRARHQRRGHRGSAKDRHAGQQRHNHLHLRHHRPPEGLRAHSREPAP